MFGAKNLSSILRDGARGRAGWSRSVKVLATLYLNYQGRSCRTCLGPASYLGPDRIHNHESAPRIVACLSVAPPCKSPVCARPPHVPRPICLVMFPSPSILGRRLGPNQYHWSERAPRHRPLCSACTESHLVVPSPFALYLCANSSRFADARLNWAENMLQSRSPSKLALIEASASPHIPLSFIYLHLLSVS